MPVRFDVVDAAATRTLRRDVLRPGLSPDAVLPGDELTDAVHVAAVEDDGTVLATCFVYPEPCPWRPGPTDAWRLRQMATRTEHRGRGLGAGVLDRAVAVVVERGGALLWCHAREPAVSFYRQHGFVVEGASFAEHGIAHRRMWRELSAGTPSS